MGSIVYVGGPRPVDLRVRKGVRLWQPADLMRRPLKRLRLIVLLPSAARGLHPTLVRSRLRALADRTIVCFTNEGGETSEAILRWYEAGFVVKQPHEVDRIVSDATGRLRRPVLEPRDWLPFEPEPGSDAARLAAAVPLLEKLSVKLLGRALHRTDAQLRSLCKRSFGCCPRRLLRLYLAASVAATPAELGPEERAQAFDYYDASTLKRALGRSRGPS